MQRRLTGFQVEADKSISFLAKYMDILKEKKCVSDKQRVEKIREGDEGAFEQLFFEYFHDLCSYIGFGQFTMRH